MEERTSISSLFPLTCRCSYDFLPFMNIFCAIAHLDCLDCGKVLPKCATSKVREVHILMVHLHRTMIAELSNRRSVSHILQTRRIGSLKIDKTKGKK